MCAFNRLSFASSGVCDPVTSMLKMVAVNVMEVMASLMKNVAVPNDAGRAAPPDVVGTVGGFSCELVRLAVSITLACAADTQSPASTTRDMGGRDIDSPARDDHPHGPRWSIGPCAPAFSARGHL